MTDIGVIRVMKPRTSFHCISFRRPREVDVDVGVYIPNADHHE